MIRSLTEASGFVIVCSIVDGLVDNWGPIKHRLDSDLDGTLNKLYSQSESIQSEYKTYSDILSKNYIQNIQKVSATRVKCTDTDEFLRSVMDDYDAIDSIISDAEGLTSKEEDKKIRIHDSFRIIPKGKADNFTQLETPANYTILHSMLNLRAKFESKLLALNSQFQLEQNRVSAMCDNLAVSAGIGPDMSVLGILSKIALMVVGYSGYCRLMNRYWPLGDSGKPFPPIKRLSFGAGMASLAAAFTVYTASGVYASYSRRFHTIETGTSEAVTGIPSVWPGATLTDPCTWQRFFILVINEPLFETVIVQRMLFRRLIASGPPVVAYSLTAVVSALCFAGDRDTNSTAAVMNLNEMPAMLSAAGYTALCSSMYHATGSLALPLLMKIWRNLSVFVRESFGRSDIQAEQLGVWAFARDIYDWIFDRFWRRAPKQASLHPLVLLLAEEATGFSSTTSPRKDSEVMSAADMVDFSIAMQHGLWGLEQRWKEKKPVSESSTMSRIVKYCRDLLVEIAEEEDANFFPVLILDAFQRQLERNFPHGLTADQVNIYVALLLNIESPQFLAQLDQQELQDSLRRWRLLTGDGAGVAAQKDRLLELVQDYHSKVLEADNLAAREVNRGIGRVFTASLAGRPATNDDLLAFQKRVKAWREIVILRSLTTFLATHGLTHRRFRLLLAEASDRFDEVRQLDQSWMAYFGSDEAKKRWKSVFDS